MKEWQRAKTTRLYLHPPKAERLFTLWREGRIMFGEIDMPITQPYTDLNGSGVWFVDGDGNAADFTESQYEVREDGIPAHKLTFFLGDFACTVECVSPFDRKPTLYGKLVVKSKSGEAISGKVGFMLRTGNEDALMYSGPDVYKPYNPSLSDWFGVDATWEFDGRFSCGSMFFEFEGAEKIDFDKEIGRAFVDVSLSAGEEKEFYFAFGRGEKEDLTFEEAKAKTIEFWEGELNRITKLPEELKKDPEKMRLVKTLTIQMLQCFCYGKDSDEFYLRQGGLQRRVWLYEAMSVLEALSKIGNFDDYVEPVIDGYFNKYFVESGEIFPLGIYWANSTAMVLYNYSIHAMTHGKDYFLKYRDKAMKCFEWIRDMRHKKVYDGMAVTRDEDRLRNPYVHVDGFFPPVRSCDHPTAFQNWLFTDGYNIIGLRTFAEACKFFDDERKDEVAAEYESYRGVMQSVFDRVVKEAKDGDEIKMPVNPSKNEEVEARYSFHPSIDVLIDVLNPEVEIVEKICNYYLKRGRSRGGLYARMPVRDQSLGGEVKTNLTLEENEFIWYVCAGELKWFKYWLRNGRLDKCQEILKDNLFFAMSDEYYMHERYHQKNVWYAPWSPNASCSGRMISMLLLACGDKTTTAE